MERRMRALSIVALMRLAVLSVIVASTSSEGDDLLRTASHRRTVAGEGRPQPSGPC